jgi:SAM-dependent methyltransferase
MRPRRLLVSFALTCALPVCAHSQPAPEAGTPSSGAPSSAAEHGNAHGHGHDHPHGPEYQTDAHDESPERFADAAAWSKVFDDPKRDAWQKPDELVRELGLKPDDIVADLGAGTGYFSVRLARAAPKGRVLAIDVSQGMLDWTKKRAERDGVTNVEVILADKSDAKLPEGVDVVLVVDTYHHLTDRVAYFRRVAERLDEGGRVVVVDFKMGKLPVGPPESHKIPPDVIESEMKRAGFARCRSWDGLPYQYVLFFAKRC